MTRMTAERLGELIETAQAPCVSIYLPTHPTGREKQQDPIRLKNLLGQARTQLVDGEALRGPEADELLSPAEDLLADRIFWQNQDRGLAIFIHPGRFEAHRMPVEFQPLAVTGERFHVKALFPLLVGQTDFYILALSQNEIRLLRADRFQAVEVDLEDIPTSLQEALRFDDPERQLQYHTGTSAPGGRGQRPSIFHGQGTPEEDERANLRRYFRKVNRGMMDLLGESQAPLVLAGVDYLIPIYESASDYPHLVKDAVIGSPDERSAEDLHREAWPLVQPIFEQDLDNALEKYHTLAGDETGSDRLAEILPAAHHGQVETLFVALDEQAWGTCAEDGADPVRHDAYQAGDEDLLNLAAVQTFLQGGRVHALESARMPAAPIAAIFRYAY